MSSILPDVAATANLGNQLVAGGDFIHVPDLVLAGYKGYSYNVAGATSFHLQNMSPYGYMIYVQPVGIAQQQRQGRPLFLKPWEERDYIGRYSLQNLLIFQSGFMPLGRETALPDGGGFDTQDAVFLHGILISYSADGAREQAQPDILPPSRYYANLAGSIPAATSSWDLFANRLGLVYVNPFCTHMDVENLSTTATVGFHYTLTFQDAASSLSYGGSIDPTHNDPINLLPGRARSIDIGGWLHRTSDGDTLYARLLFDNVTAAPVPVQVTLWSP